MIVQGSASPKKIWIRYIDENNNDVIRLTRNVIEKDITDEITNNIRKFYEYEEIEISIANRNNLEEYVLNNFDAIFEKGLSDLTLQKQIEEKDKQIKELIDNYKLLEVNQQTQDILTTIKQLTDMYGQTLDSIMFDILPNINTII